MEVIKTSPEVKPVKKTDVLPQNKDSFVYKILTGSNMLGMYGMHFIELNDNVQNDSSRDLPGNGTYEITELIIRKDKQDKPLGTILLFVPRDKKAWGLMSVQWELSDEKVKLLFETMSVVSLKFNYSEEPLKCVTGPPEVENGIANHEVYITAYNLRNLCRKIIYYSMIEGDMK